MRGLGFEPPTPKIIKISKKLLSTIKIKELTETQIFSHILMKITLLILILWILLLCKYNNM